MDGGRSPWWVQFIIAMVGLGWVLLWWLWAKSFLEHLVLFAPALAFAIWRHERSKHDVVRPCPHCGSSLRDVKTPLVVRMGLTVIIGFVAWGSIILMALLLWRLGVSGEIILAAVLVGFAVYVVLRAIVFSRIDAVDREPLYVCGACHRRFTGKQMSAVTNV
jgi:hypothetical protein